MAPRRASPRFASRFDHDGSVVIAQELTRAVRDPRRRARHARRGRAPSVPKALIPVAGEPFAAHQLALLSRAGVRRVVYCIGHLGEAIRTFVGSGERWGVEVSYVEDGETLLGTGGALRRALDPGRSIRRSSFSTATRICRSTTGPYGTLFWLPPSRRSSPCSGTRAAGTRATCSTRTGGSHSMTSYGRIPARRAWCTSTTGFPCSPARCSTASCRPERPSTSQDVYKTLSLEGQLAGHEVRQRFYEAGSPSGLQDLEAYLEAAASRRPSG